MEDALLPKALAGDYSRTRVDGEIDPMSGLGRDGATSWVQGPGLIGERRGSSSPYGRAPLAMAQHVPIRFGRRRAPLGRDTVPSPERQALLGPLGPERSEHRPAEQ